MSRRYLCPVCRAPRKTELSDQLSMKTHAKIGITVLAVSGVVLMISDQAAAFKALFIYLPVWSVAEFFHWVRMREATKCKSCNFDPILYRRDWRAARRQVEDRLNGIVSELKNRAAQNAVDAGRPLPEIASKSPDKSP